MEEYKDKMMTAKFFFERCKAASPVPLDDIELADRFARYYHEQKLKSDFISDVRDFLYKESKNAARNSANNNYTNKEDHPIVVHEFMKGCFWLLEQIKQNYR